MRVEYRILRVTDPSIDCVLGEQGYDVTKLIAEADEDGNGAINLQEFCNHMRKR